MSRILKPSRRAFLRGAAGSLLALPFLEATQAHGQQTGPTRFVVFVNGQGNLPTRWTPPQLAGDALELSEMLQPLSPHKDKVMVLSGVDNRLPSLHTSNGHNAAGHTLLSANLVDTTGNGYDPDVEVSQGDWCLGPSIDHYLAAMLGSQLPLNLAIGGTGTGENRMFYQMKDPSTPGANPEAPLENDPNEIYATNLAGLPSGSTTTREDRFRAQRANVLGGVSASFAELKKKLGQADTQRIERHLDALADLESQLDYTPPIECGEIPLEIPADFMMPNSEKLGFDVHADVITTLASQILACGAREIVTIQNTQYHAPPFEFIPQGPVDGWHAQVHNDPALNLGYGSADDNPVLRAGFLHYAEVFESLLAKMDAIVEPNGKTLLDNSVVIWMSEFGTGQTHSTSNLPIVIAGGGGVIEMDRHLHRPDATTNDLFVSLLNAFGVMDTTFGYTGDSSLNNGAIPGLVG